MGRFSTASVPRHTDAPLTSPTIWSSRYRPPRRRAHAAAAAGRRDVPPG
ncbi:MAG TPA: hypothetical protein VLX31_10290 [Streptosporangiaceae bacterium]|nr:hypothetical protein [Streptosporangiaceae bacterium]